MNEDEIKLKLLANTPVYVEGIGNFQLPTIKRVIGMSENLYHMHLSRILFSKSQLESTSEDISDYSDMDVLASLMLHDPSFRETMFDALRTFFDSEPMLFENGLIYFDELSENAILTQEKWDLIKKMIRIGNFIPEESKEEEYQAGNERARKFMEEQKKRKAMLEKLKKKEQKINLHSILSAVSWRTDGIKKILRLTIYQLYDGYYRLGLVDSYQQTMTGIYTGNIDGSKIKLPDINWANVIKIK
ncbi:hypothetical protein AF332_11230 [Sporosarcina globispora]|uniref:Uncharacterized protein n=1 Tax=Sporosarcina globispora TaxID=1459 RepID=A0A0M0GD39_SPOGL|nr:hypothetical protein [Sporosarcina globispora]KON87341.1 hypothetical protein AF332_11230 [Sporosarcina globispora]